MSQGLINGKIYLKEKEIVVERIVFKSENRMIVFLDNDDDYKELESNNNFDVHFNDTILLNCGVNEFNNSENACIGIYEVKRNVA
ncbi:hypothetical protein KQY27_09075 [Methanobrevibacter sp. TMH8]|uniref:hypothetical protein n=1 Tax=Methanobrevibacter sp. TMH8 TaxID=2848611 RepID=UPI001CCCA8F7|nr:hypothetical protein [Methanobrevibacter sp. TMH8]MBZ9571697.1 hypothetical protein [Methanobrevibacter sp. TMH8]